MDAEAGNEQREDETSAFVSEVDRTKRLFARTPPSPWRRTSRPTTTTTKLERSCQRRCGTTCSCTVPGCTVFPFKNPGGERGTMSVHRFLLAASKTEEKTTCMAELYDGLARGARGRPSDGIGRRNEEQRPDGE